MKKSLIAAGLMIATSLAIPAFACPAGGSCDGPRGAQGMQQGKQNGMQRMAKDLNLSQEQQTQIQKIRSESRETMRAMRDTMLANRDAMEKLDPTAKDYMAQVDKLAAEKGAIVEGMTQEHARVRAEMAAILTPEQRIKADALRKERKAKRAEKKGEGRGNWGKGRGGPDGDGPGNGPRGGM